MPNNKKIKLKNIPYTFSQRTANKLMTLYREMEFIDKYPDLENKFEQNNCDSCVIGQSIRSGCFGKKFNNRHSYFNQAVKSIHLPDIAFPQSKRRGLLLMCGELNILETYLFGSSLHIRVWGDKLGLYNKSATPVDAMLRIKAVLNKAGYDIVWDHGSL